MNIAIIGTAGRNEIPNQDTWAWAKSGLNDLLKTIKEKTNEDICLGSGGAAYADALAPHAFLNNPIVSTLDLFLPSKDWNYPLHEYDDSPCGKISNYYHRRAISSTQGFNSLLEIENSMNSDNCTIHLEGLKGTKRDFFTRNTSLANWAEIVIAFTFGGGNGVRDGGTKDTVNKFLARGIRPHVTHFDLSTQTAYLYKGE